MIESGQTHYKIGKMSSFKFLFFGWLFASQKKREMHSISRPEFALQTRAFQGYVRTSCYLHSFATLMNARIASMKMTGLLQNQQKKKG